MNVKKKVCPVPIETSPLTKSLTLIRVLPQV